jgi:hypothetical protein
MTRTSALRDRGEDRASFQDRGRDNMFSCSRDEGEDRACFLRQRWRVRTSGPETEGKKELPFKTEVERKFLMCKRRRGRQSMFFMTRTSALRDRGEDRASFQDRGREKIRT